MSEARNPVMVAPTRMSRLASILGIIDSTMPLAAAHRDETIVPRYAVSFLGGGGCFSPADFGRSASCRRLVRKNRMRALGIGSDHS